MGTKLLLQVRRAVVQEGHRRQRGHEPGRHELARFGRSKLWRGVSQGNAEMTKRAAAGHDVKFQGVGSVWIEACDVFLAVLADLRPMPMARRIETPMASCSPVVVLPCAIIRLWGGGGSGDGGFQGGCKSAMRVGSQENERREVEGLET